MTRDEKFKAIIERMRLEDEKFVPEHISMMVITGYLDNLSKAGLLESAYTVTPMGKTIMAICEEFDWKPSDDDIMLFVRDMIDKPEQPAFLFLLRKYRDDREGLLEEFEKSKQSGDETLPS
jgi:hypothetical protein